MSTVVFDIITYLLVIAGGLFIFAGTVGLLRFPDPYSRLHALTKADNLGLGLIVAGLLFQARSAAEVLQLILIWMLVLVTSSVSCYLLASSAISKGIKPKRRA